MFFGLFVILVAGIVVFALQPRLTVGGLRWNTLSQSFNLPAGTSTHQTTFHFQNVSHSPINIQSVQPDCNCLVPNLTKRAIAPGESGDLTVIFDPGDRAGTLKRTLKVWTKEFPKEPAILTLTYTIPELIKVSNRLLMWPLKSNLQPQDISIEMPDESIRVTSVRSSNQVFDCKVVPVAEGHEYKIEVTPRDSSTPKQSVLIISTDYPKAPWNRIVANVRIE